MTGIEGMRIWVMTEIEYDENGNAKVLRSFSKPSANSPIKQKQKTKTKHQATESGREELF